ncbi:MAG TPA: four helix bundle protein [Chthoniobacterales bacterium]|nr:four helix bundle protein [Chthoniobacterales bacterium]
MKMRKTPNAERPTLNIEFRKLSVNETADGDYGTRPKYDLEERLLEFTANVVRLADSLPNTKAGNHIAGQLLRSGTSPLANHGEVEAAESRKDFLHKLRICLKELRETWRWLGLIGRLDLSKARELRAALTEVEELIRIFAASVRTTEKNAK